MPTFRFEALFEADDLDKAKEFMSSLSAVLKTSDVNHSLTPPIQVQTELTDAPLQVYTDGGCDLKKNGLGAWGFVILYGDGTKQEEVGAALGTTNNKMELQAVIQALKAIEFGRTIQVFSDSEYVVKGTTLWARSWVRNGWQTKDGKPVANQDLWAELLQLYQLHDVELIHIPGHSGHEWNDYVDAMCTQAMKEHHKSLLASEQYIENQKNV